MQPEPTKKCIRCFSVKPLHVFEKKKREVNYRNVCKTCRTTNSKMTYKLKRAYIKEHGQPAAYSPCKICKSTPKTLVFDHCHRTNKFRGWICRNCNAAIGKLGDNLSGLMKAVKYLEETELVQTNTSKQSVQLKIDIFFKKES